MTNKKSKIANLIYSTLLGVGLCVIGLFLILFCISIFRSGEKPFTREVIGEYLSRLAIPTAVCLAAIVFAPIFEVMLPSEKIKIRAERDVYAILRRERGKLEAKSETKLTLPETKKRTVLRGVCIALCVLAFVPALVYVLTGSNFSGNDTTSEVLRAASVTLVCAAFSGVIFLTVNHFDRKLAETELVRVRELQKELTDVKCKDSEARRFPTLLAVRIAILIIGLTFIILGVLNGGYSDVLGKAINICYECIGLG